MRATALQAAGRETAGGRGSYPGTQAVQRALGLLKAFTAERPVLRLLELAALAGLNKTTAYRLLSALVNEGLLERLPESRGYRLGPELLALGSRALGASGLHAASRAELQALAFATRETATLEVLVGRDVLILDEAAGDYVVGSMPSLGTRWPAHTTSTGKVLLAHLPAPALDQLLGSPLAAATARTITDPLALRRELARVRERGWALASEELEAGFLAVGVPVRGAGGEVVAAVSVGGPRARLNQARVRQLIALLPKVADRISGRLGFTPPAGRAPGRHTRAAPPATTKKQERASR
ncbi:MAG TPA: IclR family transcriptional regulator [Thermoanaerobaculia bacterium]|jgi:DNA-binding IclR family transcriptional regulator|nr:IclR family transcriptional regulator [Thermoanaerobaculia bacterium]